MTVERLSAWVSLITGPVSVVLGVIGLKSLNQAAPYTPPQSQVVSVSLAIMVVAILWAFVQSIHVRWTISIKRKHEDIVSLILGLGIAMVLAFFLFAGEALALFFTAGAIATTRDIYALAGTVTFLFVFVSVLSSIFVAGS